MPPFWSLFVKNWSKKLVQLVHKFGSWTNTREWMFFVFFFFFDFMGAKKRSKWNPCLVQEEREMENWEDS